MRSQYWTPSFMVEKNLGLLLMPRSCKQLSGLSDDKILLRRKIIIIDTHSIRSSDLQLFALVEIINFNLLAIGEGFTNYFFIYIDRSTLKVDRAEFSCVFKDSTFLCFCNIWHLQCSSRRLGLVQKPTYRINFHFMWKPLALKFLRGVAWWQRVWDLHSRSRVRVRACTSCKSLGQPGFYSLFGRMRFPRIKKKKKLSDFNFISKFTRRCPKNNHFPTFVTVFVFELHSIRAMYIIDTWCK
jgi:hypothetical protein